jgi:hypothetical protein
MEHCSKDYETKFNKFCVQFVCHTCSQHDSNLKKNFLTQNKMRQPISKVPGRTRDLRISVAVAVAWMTQTRDLSSASWPWSPHSLSWRSYLGFTNKIMKLISGLLQHQLFKVRNEEAIVPFVLCALSTDQRRGWWKRLAAAWRWGRSHPQDPEEKYRDVLLSHSVETVLIIF